MASHPPDASAGDAPRRRFIFRRLILWGLTGVWGGALLFAVGFACWQLRGLAFPAANHDSPYVAVHVRNALDVELRVTHAMSGVRPVSGHAFNASLAPGESHSSVFMILPRLDEGALRYPLLVGGEIVLRADGYREHELRVPCELRPSQHFQMEIGPDGKAVVRTGDRTLVGYVSYPRQGTTLAW